MRRFALAVLVVAGLAGANMSAALRADDSASAYDRPVLIGGETDSCRFAIAEEGPWRHSILDVAETTQGGSLAIRLLKGTPWDCATTAIAELEGAGITPLFAPLRPVVAMSEVSTAEVTSHPEATPYDPYLDATAAVDAALVRALERGTLVMVVLGANWCHDSRALAGWLQTERFAALVSEHYEVVYVDAGHPQSGEGRNLDIAARLGVENVTGTPTLLIVDIEGSLLNPDTAKSWRNAASRSEDEIYEELALAATTEIARD